MQRKLLHVPGTGRTTLGTHAAMQTDVLVLDHHSTSFQRIGNQQGLVGILRRRFETHPQISFFTIRGKGDAFGWTDINAGVALDTDLGREYGLDIAVEATLRFGTRHQRIEAKLKLKLEAHKAKAKADPKNWGYSGDLRKVESDLADILAFIN